MSSKTVPFYASLVRGTRFQALHHLAKSLRADRLRTIIGYDRICVLDAGQIAVSLCTAMVEMGVNGDKAGI